MSAQLNEARQNAQMSSTAELLLKHGVPKTKEAWVRLIESRAYEVHSLMRNFTLVRLERFPFLAKMTRGSRGMVITSDSFSHHCLADYRPHWEGDERGEAQGVFHEVKPMRLGFGLGSVTNEEARQMKPYDISIWGLSRNFDWFWVTVNTVLQAADGGKALLERPRRVKVERLAFADIADRFENPGDLYFVWTGLGDIVEEWHTRHAGLSQRALRHAQTMLIEESMYQKLAHIV